MVWRTTSVGAASTHFGLSNQEYCKAAVTVVKLPPILTMAPQPEVVAQTEFERTDRVLFANAGRRVELRIRG